MSFQRRPRFDVFPTTRARGPIFAVGGHAYVANLHGNSSEVTLTDEHGRAVLATLADGSEVTILGWRQNPVGATRYRVCVKATGIEGWVPGETLRATAVPRSISQEHQ